jgi:hypothetical protein
MATCNTLDWQQQQLAAAAAVQVVVVVVVMMMLRFDLVRLLYIIYYVLYSIWRVARRRRVSITALRMMMKEGKECCFSIMGENKRSSVVT